MRANRTRFIVSVIGGLVAILVFTEFTAAHNRWTHLGHWSRQDHNVAHMSFVDATGTPWPVYNKHQDWDRADKLDVRYASSQTECGHHCVRADVILPENDPDFDQECTIAGKSNAAFGGQVGSGNHYLESVKVEFNHACNSELNDYRRAIVTCHEMGHALGLTHFPPNVNDCMWEHFDVATSLESSGHDRQTMLDQTIYDH